MPRQKIHFVTGRLAEHALRRTVESLAAEAGFDYTIDVLPITVAALMTPKWIAKHISIPQDATRVLLPGYCEGDVAVIQSATSVPVERGPRDLRRLPEYFGRETMANEYGQYDIQIIAEINHAPRLTLEEIIREARKLADDGADLIDVGCDPGDAWSGVGDCVKALRDEGLRVSIDSLNPAEIAPAVAAGAELVLSVNSTNRDAAQDWGCEVVAIPDDPASLSQLDETVEVLAKDRVPLRIDAILEPIAFGFAASLGRYLEVRRRYPDSEMMMGIGNLTELTDVDSAGVNTLLLGFCQELGIRSVLTTQVINWARTSVKECDLARRLVFHAIENKVPPKHLEPKLVTLRDAKINEFGADELAHLAAQIKDNNYRIFAEGGVVHVLVAGLHLEDTDPFMLFEKLLATEPTNVDASHAFYLGYEMAKAVTALTLGKDYQQDEALDWGYLTVEEKKPPAEKVEELISNVTDETIAIVEELRPVPDVEQAFKRLSGRPYCLFLDSAQQNRELGRYSFITCDPFDFLRVPAEGSDGLGKLQAHLAKYAATTLPDLPPFQGGAAGLFSYDLGHSLERLPRPRYDEFRTPALAIGLYDTVIAFDHQLGRAWIVSQGFPEQDAAGRHQRATDRIEQFRSWLNETPTEVARPARQDHIAMSELAPQYSVDGYEHLTSSFSPDGYRQTIQRVIDYIHAGDVFQVNLSHRLLHSASCDSTTLYLRLRKSNPAPFAAYFDLDDFQIVSASPERLISVRDRHVEARPIKGTRQVIRRPEADLFAGDDLRQSEKDRAENVMIVDLLRNDISRVCQPDSVHVTDLCRLEVYQYVQHLVSVVRGRLADDANSLDVIRATFPGGSVTGAPKVRAMEIIAELEPTARGPYCGSIGYVGFDGTTDLSILIRTITAGRGWWQLPVGGGIIAQSDPKSEYEETWHKAKGLIKALQ